MRFDYPLRVVPTLTSSPRRVMQRRFSPPPPPFLSLYLIWTLDEVLHYICTKTAISTFTLVIFVDLELAEQRLRCNLHIRCVEFWNKVRKEKLRRFCFEELTANLFWIISEW